MTQRKLRRGFNAALATLATAATVATFATVATAPAAAAQSEPGITAEAPSAINGYRNVGYFTQWGVYGRNFQAKQLDVSGAAADLTHINYSFGNIHHQTLECFIANKAQGTGPNGSDGAGDAWADYGMGYTAANSVAGVADKWDQPMAGSFNQLKQLKAKYPNLKVMLSMGGWTWSKNFSAAAATDASRKKLVSSCMDIYIKGNLPMFDGRGGKGAAAGVFDGFDIDWEWPGSNNGEVGNIVDEVNDKANFKALLKEFRTQLDAYTATSGKKYQLSAFLPANVADIDAGGWNDPELFNYLDFGNIQGYDLHGAWDPTLTGHQGNLYDDPTDTRAAHRQFSVDKSVREYLKTGIDPAQLGIGLAAYGRGWKGATSADAWGPATAAGPGTWEKGNEDYDKLKNLGTGYYDAAIGAAWRYDGDQWWSYDDTRTTAQKAQYLVDLKLGGAMWWDLTGDRQGELIGTMADALRAAPAGPATDPGPGSGTTDPGTTDPGTTDPGTTDPGTTDPGTTDPGTTDPTTGACVSPAWSSSAVYTGGAKVSHNGSEYTAKWWTQGDKPGTNAVWNLVSACDSGSGNTDPGTTDPGTTDPGTTDPAGTTCVTAWSAGSTYPGGSTASYQGFNYKSKWWTQGEKPGSSAWGAWESVAACG